MIYINITYFVLISLFEKDHSTIEKRFLKDVAIFFQTILSFVLSRKKIKLVVCCKTQVGKDLEGSLNFH